jgi:hypothetical protein
LPASEKLLKSDPEPEARHEHGAGGSRARLNGCPVVIFPT